MQLPKSTRAFYKISAVHLEDRVFQHFRFWKGRNRRPQILKWSVLLFPILICSNELRKSITFQRPSEYSFHFPMCSSCIFGKIMSSGFKKKSVKYLCNQQKTHESSNTRNRSLKVALAFIFNILSKHKNSKKRCKNYGILEEKKKHRIEKVSTIVQINQMN